MYTTTALVALGEYLVAPCPKCDCLVLLRRQGASADAARTVPGRTACRGCGEPLAGASVRIPATCWRERVARPG